MPHHIALGAAGWERPDWSDTFYPAGIPEEWRLTYFNTQFGCVFLAADVWRCAGPEAYAAWAGDSHERFVFLLEDALPDEVPAVLADKALGVGKEDARLLWFDRETSLKLLAGRFAAGEAAAPLFLLSADGDLGQIERVRTLLELMGL